MNQEVIWQGQEGFVDTNGATVSKVDNPQPNVLGCVGEAPLPYTVPAGYTLTLTAYGIEAYNVPGTVVIFPWVGSLPSASSKAGFSCSASGGSNECCGCRAVYPAGTVLNFTILNGEPLTNGVHQRCAWYARAYLSATS